MCVGNALYFFSFLPPWHLFFFVFFQAFLCLSLPRRYSSTGTNRRLHITSTPMTVVVVVCSHRRKEWFKGVCVITARAVESRMGVFS